MSLNSMLKRQIIANPGLFKAAIGMARKAGFDIVNGLSAPVALLRHYEIDLILDVGANEGQFGSWARAVGYEGRIVSYEPVSTAFDVLTKRIAKDPTWTAERLAIGERVGELAINVSQNSVYSSARARSALLEANDESSSIVRTEIVAVRTIDSLLAETVRPGERVLIKIDTQGFEREVIAGAVASLPKITGLMLELSFRKLYEGEASIDEIVATLAGHGFALVSLQPLAINLKYGKLYEADGMFFRI